jgi:hypothetical protein
VFSHNSWSSASGRSGGRARRRIPVCKPKVIVKQGRGSSGSRPALSGFEAKFPVLENNFPVFAPKIPCSIIQGIASKVPKTSAYLSITNAATFPCIFPC